MSSKSPSPPAGSRNVRVGTLFMIVGIFWALIGVGNFCFMALKNPGAYRFTVGFSLMFQSLFFVFPGLLLAGVGLFTNKKTARNGHVVAGKEAE